MASRFSLCLLLCSSFLGVANSTFAQAKQNSGAPSSPLQVIYVVDGTSILTYNVDPHTLNASQVGNPLKVNNASTFNALIPSPDGHFLYFIATDAQLNKRLWVFATDGL